jgi:hypothetical protein
MKIVLASPHDIRLSKEPMASDVRYQKARLLKEGQIEPTVVKQLRPDTEDGCLYRVDLEHDEAFHLSDAQIKAAQELDWPTVQVTF